MPAAVFRGRDTMTSADDRLQTLFPDDAKIPAQYRISPIEDCQYLINGELRCWKGSTQEVYSPVMVRSQNGFAKKYLGRYPLLTRKEALEALDAAAQAYDNGMGAWPTMAVSDRISCFKDFVFRIKQKRTEVVNLLMWEIGKSLADSEKEFDRTVEYIEATIEALKEVDRVGSRFQIEQGIIGQIRRAPLGVALCMGPFNYPLNETFTTLIPALMMGNTVIFKQPKIGVLLHSPLLEAFRDCFPKGVINMVYGRGEEVAGPLVETGKVNVLAFIGTSRVADQLKKQHPKPHRLRCVLGLDAKNPAIILPDADLELAVKECVLGTLSYNGQRCTALKILFVHSKVADEFVKRFSAAVEALKIGMPWEKDVLLTPLPEPKKTEYLSGLVDDAKKLGAAVMNPSGGKQSGTLFFPAVLFPVKEGMRTYVEEQFGPVVPIVPFDDIKQPIDYIVNSDYGQQVSVFGSDPAAIARLVDPLVNQVCRVNLNSQCQRGPDTFPFTGRKDSAEGTLSVSDALRVFSIRTLVAAKGSETNKAIITDMVRNHRSNFLTTDYIL